MFRKIMGVVGMMTGIQVLAQPPSISWTDLYSQGTGRCVQQTFDGGYIVTGYWEGDALLIKVGPTGLPQFTKTFYESGSVNCTGEFVVQTYDGGYAITGRHSGYPESVIWLLKTDAWGNELWNRVYSGQPGNSAGGRCIQQTADLGFIIVGENGMGKPYLVKTDLLGNEQWNQVLISEGGEGRAVKQTSDGGFVVVAQIDRAHLIKTNQAGAISWDVSFADCYAYDVEQTADGGFAFCGYTAGNDVLLVKTDANGSQIWNRTFGGIYTERGFAMDLTYDNGFILTGDINWETNPDALLLKTDAEGNEEWTIQCPSPPVGFDRGFSVQQTMDWGYIVAGDLWNIGLVKFEGQPPASVSLIPQNPPIIIPSTGGSFQFITEVVSHMDTTQSLDFWTYITLPYGQPYGPIFIRRDINFAALDTITRQMTQDVGQGAPGGIYTYHGYVGDFPSNVYDQDSFTFSKLGDDLDCTNLLGSDFRVSGWDDEIGMTEAFYPSLFSLHPCRPNPFNPSTVIRYELPEADFVRLSVYDISGRDVSRVGFGESDLQGWREAGLHEATFDGSKLAAGVYIAKLEAGDYVGIQKMVLLK